MQKNVGIKNFDKIKQAESGTGGEDYNDYKSMGGMTVDFSKRRSMQQKRQGKALFFT
jgi:hypothetical protein